MNRIFRLGPIASAAATSIALVACGGGSGETPADSRMSPNAASVDEENLPQLAAAVPAQRLACNELLLSFYHPNTRLVEATLQQQGALKVAGEDVREHCRVTGTMNARVSTVDGKPYAIGFEMRLPTEWNGRFFYQANGGTDGSIATATGPVNGGGGLTHALAMGFAVISSDAGHQGPLQATFGYDPQARLDYGYQAVGSLTPMAKKLISLAYGKGPDRSYFGGCSNGGRHTLVATTRYADQYDGFLAGAPGYNLPLAAMAQLYGAQQYARVSGSSLDLAAAFTPAERRMVADRILEKCDVLDGAKDGIVQDTAACQSRFSLQQDVASCTGARDGSCLTAEQKNAIGNVFTGVRNSKGESLYASFPFDPGLTGGGWATWEFTAPYLLDASTVGMIFSSPPAALAGFNPVTYAQNYNFDTDPGLLAATNATFQESGLSFMRPVNPGDLSQVRNRGGKVMVYHGAADAIFSVNDTIAWWDNLRRTMKGDVSRFARVYSVPGMDHCSGGPSTDQFDMLTPLVEWVEQGKAPQAILAQARGPGNAAGANGDVPGDWSATRSRPLCVWPKVARYKGTGSIEDAASFACQ